MSRIFVIEVPDKYELTAKEFISHISEKYPDVELKISANFSWWKKISSILPLDGILPLMIDKKNLNNVDEFISSIRYPKSIEEREVKNDTIY